MQPTDAEIMEQVQSGQLALFDELVARYRGALLRVAVSKLGDEAWAEDVVQETFLAVYAARHSYKPEFAFRTWLWTILLNNCKKQWKRSQRKPRVVSESALPTEVARSISEPTVSDSGLQGILLTERRELVHELLNRLSEVQADALRLRFFGGLQFDEISDSMGCSLSGAKRRVKTGLEALSRMLDERKGDLP